MTRAGTIDRSAIRNEIEHTGGFVGAIGIYEFSEQDHMGLDLGSFRMAEIRAGSWVLIE